MTMKKPNVLFITIDQLRADCLETRSERVVKTPNLDALAAQGVRFANHFTQASPCGPSRASLLTGTYLHTHQSVFNGTPLDDKFTNLAKEFRAAGYDPLLFGYTDTTIDPRTVDENDPRLLTYEGHLPGFNVALPLPEDREAWYQWLSEKGYDISDREKFLKGDEEIDIPHGRGKTWPPSPYEKNETETAFVIGEVIDRLENLNEPWFLHVSILRPHPPFVVPGPYNDLYDPADFDEPISPSGSDHPFIDSLSTIDFFKAPSESIDKLQLKATYSGMVTEVDDQIGRLIGFLDEKELADETIVLVTSDHGELLGDHGLVSKFGFHDKAFHIPMIIRYPALEGPKGLIVEEFTENVDVMPTLLDLAGLSTPTQCEGYSVRGFLEGEKLTEWRKTVHWEFDFRVFAERIGLPLNECRLIVHRDGRGKLVHFLGMPDIFFDLEADENEQHPLFEHSLMESFSSELNEWLPEIPESPLVNLLATAEGMINLKNPE